MQMRKAVVKTGVMMLLSVFLSGCGLPVGVTIAGWAIDGISLLTTEKSVSDHGISTVAQRDCALWRVFKGESVCREPAGGSVQVADASDDAAGFDDLTVDDVAAAVSKPLLRPVSVAETSPVDTASPADSPALATAPGEPIPLPGIGEANKNPQVSQGGIRVADAEGGSGLLSRPPPPAAPSTIEPVDKAQFKERLSRPHSTRPVPVDTVKAREKPITGTVNAKAATDDTSATFEPVVEFETPKPATVQKPKRTVRQSPAPMREKREPAVDSATARPGLYYVLGSFSVAANARRLAKKAAALEPKIVAAAPKGKRVLRVLVGPFTKAQQSRIKADIRAAKIGGSWVLHVNG
ncbi:MAG: SPOR domain-containing protein [Rhodospirillales bacterium]